MLDRRFFSKCLIDLIDANATGIYNLASADVFSKEEFLGKLQINWDFRQHLLCLVLLQS